MLRMLKQCWALAPPRLRRLWWVLAALSFINALVEVIAAMAMVVLMTFLAGNELPKLPAGELIRTLTSPLQSATGLRLLCLWLTFIFTVKYLIGTAIIVFEIRLPLAAGNAVVGRLFRLYLAAPYEFHMRRNSAETIRNLAGCIDVLYRNVAPAALSLIAESVSISAIIALLLASAPKQTIIVGLIAILSLFSLYRIFHHRLLIWGLRQKDLNRDVLIHARQSLDGMKEIRIAGRETFFWRRYMDARTGLSQALAHEAQLQEIPKFLLEACFIGMVLVAVLVFSYRPDPVGTLPMLGLFAYSGLRIFPSAARVLRAVQLIRSSGPAAADIFADFSELSKVTASEPIRLSGGRLFAGEGIEINNVTFRYEGATHPALKDISAKILPGQVIAFVGSSGAGKSTLVNVLLGLLIPQQGTIRFNGNDIHQDLRGWQSLIGYVPQSPFILDDTLCRNVAFGVPDAEIDNLRVEHALEQARLAEVVHSMPNGLHTHLGEHGLRLSGGEKQRVAIARALYCDPAIIVFDEATSAIDNLTERYITEAIERMHGERTVIIITHQLSLTHACDSIVFLDEGRIVASGGFAELHREHAGFRDLLK